MTAIACTLICVFTFYSSFAYLAIKIYGTDVKMNILDNFANEKGWLVFPVQALFFIVFLGNSPYTFFPGKLSIINIVAEYR